MQTASTLAPDDHAAVLRARFDLSNVWAAGAMLRSWLRTRTMAFRTTTLERMDKRVHELIRGFSNFVKIFEDSGRFSGPSVYFHRRTLERLRAHSSVTEALGDDAFIESLYATLVSWGMHRMGGRGARMVDLDAFKASLLSQQEGI